jgi:hypothetical protein
VHVVIVLLVVGRTVLLAVRAAPLPLRRLVQLRVQAAQVVGLRARVAQDDLPSPLAHVAVLLVLRLLTSKVLLLLPLLLELVADLHLGLALGLLRRLLRRDLDVVVGHGRLRLLQNLLEFRVGILAAAAATTVAVFIVIADALLATTAEFNLVLGHLFLALAAAFAAAGFFGRQRGAPAALASSGLLLLLVVLVKIELLVVLLLLGPAGSVPVAERDLVLLLLALLLTRCVNRQCAL